ncbi:MAG: response regulator [Chloroflexi bacterium]|nr:response regulator [Chloroflexota bacterium]
MQPTRLLLVEDSPDVAQLTQEYLEMKGGYKVDTVAHVSDFWSQVAAEDYDALLLDYNLPDGNGLEILEKLTDQGIKTPAIMITGRGDERVAAKTVQAGAADYVIKTGNYLDTLPEVLTRVIERARLKRALAEAERRHRDLFEQASDGILVCDGQGAILDANPALCRWLDFSLKELAGQSMARLLASEQTEDVRALCENLAAEGSLFYEAVYRRRDGSTLPVEVSARLVAARGPNHPAFTQFFVRNITRRKEMGAENARLFQDLQRSLEALQTAQAQLVRVARLTAVGELAAGIAHQINNPLTTIIADAQLLLKSISPAHPGHASASAIYQAGWRAQRVIQRLLNFSRPDEGQFIPTSVNETIIDSLDLIGAHIQRGGIELQINLAPDLPYVPASSHQLEEVWINLLMNARDALAENRPGLITLMSRLGDDRETVEVQVADNGRGISEANLDQIFTPFFTTKGEERGNGLGLSVCQSVVQNHGGHIAFNSKPGRGTTFLVKLPLVRKSENGGTYEQ